MTKGNHLTWFKLTGLGWDVKQKENGFFGKLFKGAKEEEFDLDVIAFLLDSNGKLQILVEI